MHVGLIKSLKFRMVILLLPIFVLYLVLNSYISYLDNHFFRDFLRDSRSKFFYGEDWEGVAQLPSVLNYDWLNSEKPLRIGHALGASTSTEANQLSALSAARSAGLRVLEVDIWLTEGGELRCFHGPGDPGPLQSDSCTLERLIFATKAWRPWIMLDIKTDFSKTSALILMLLEKYPQESSRIIFQLYKPEDVAKFKDMNSVINLAGPVITGYASHSSSNMLLKGALISGIKALTMTFHRKSWLNKDVSEIRLLAHPIHDCIQFNRAINSGFTGVYTLSHLNC